MLTGPGSDEAFPPPVFPAPPLLAEFPPEPPLVAAPCSAPPGAPGCLPSGEIATFEARFPCGTFTTGAGGPGLEESAITLCRPSLPDAAETSGAAPASACTCLRDRKSTRLNSSHMSISYAVFCLKKKKKTTSLSEHKKKKNTKLT